MSKILDAMQDGFYDRMGPTGRPSQSDYQLGTMDMATLFPPPPESLLLELDNITGALISRRRSDEGMAIVFTSATSGEGVSFVSYCVARHLAYLLSGHIAWVDVNHRAPHPKIRHQQPSYRSLLLDPSHAGEVPSGGGLTVVGHGTEEIKHTELITCGNFEEILGDFRKRFYFTIFDGPAILDAMETAHMARYCDGAVLVVETRKLKYEVIRHGLEQLRSQGGSIFGSVLNKRTFQIPNFLYRKL
jgi:Mrp family chromosome partitioning ATPase